MAKKHPGPNEKTAGQEQALNALGDVLSKTIHMARDCLSGLDDRCSGETMRRKLSALLRFNEIAYHEVFVDGRVPSVHRRQRERLVNLFQNMVNGFCHNRIVLNDERKPHDFVILEVNRGMEDILGMSRQEMTGKRFFQLFPNLGPLAVRGIRDRLGRMIKAGNFTFEDEGYFPPLNKWFLISGFSTGTGSFALLIYDVTKRKQVEQALEQALQTIQEAVSTRDRFLTALSHDIRIPISSIRNTTLTVKSMDEEARYEQQCDVIARSCDHLLMMIDELTSPRSPGSTPPRENAETFSPEQDLVGLCEEFRSRAESKGLVLQAIREGQVPALVQGPRRALHRILYNLLDNSLKFTDKGEVRARISYPRAEGQDRHRLLFSISDTGPGVPDESLDEIFKPHVRVEAKDEEAKPGSGLGLATARAMVRELGGSLCLESSPGRGCTFHCLVPIEGILRHGPDHRPVPLPLDLLGTRLLLVEDNDLNAQATASLLGAMGLKPFVASSVEETLDVLRREKPDLVLMDIEISGRDGLELTRRIRADESLGPIRDLPIIGHSGHPPEQYRQRCLDAGMNEYLRKPLRRKELVRVLEDLLTGPKTAPADDSPTPGDSAPGKGKNASFSVLLEEYGGQAGIVRQLLANFLAAYDRELANLQDILADRDLDALALAAHGIKSSLYSIHAEEEADLAGKLESEAKAGRMPEAELMLELSKRVSDLADAARLHLEAT